MAWIEIRANTNKEKAEALSDLLMELGALAVTVQDAGDQPIYEPDPGTTPVWEHVVLVGLFEEKVDIEIILLTLYAKFPAVKLTLHTLADQAWERAWMKDFQPMQFGHRLWILPSHQQHVGDTNQVILDPGLAFGTGKHPTTALCLQWLDENIKGNEVIVDYGCGSGILAIAALKLGAKKAFAIDHDLQALSATKDNAEKNHLSLDEIVVLQPEEYKPQTIDILIANILANPLIELAPKFASMLPINGKIVLSGILSHQANQVINAYQSLFIIDQLSECEEWARIDATRK